MCTLSLLSYWALSTSVVVVGGENVQLVVIFYPLSVKESLKDGDNSLVLRGGSVSKDKDHFESRKDNETDSPKM